MTRLALGLCVATLLTISARSEVLDVSAAGFTVKTSVEVAAPPSKVYDTLVGQVGAWWEPAHTWSGNPANLSIDARAGGCFCETLPGGSVQHMRVLVADRGKALRMSGGLGPLQELPASGVMSLDLAPVSAGTRIEMTYRVGGYSKDGLTALAPLVDKVLTDQMGRLKRFIETGKA